MPQFFLDDMQRKALAASLKAAPSEHPAMAGFDPEGAGPLDLDDDGLRALRICLEGAADQLPGYHRETAARLLQRAALFLGETEAAAASQCEEEGCSWAALDRRQFARLTAVIESCVADKKPLVPALREAGFAAASDWTDLTLYYPAWEDPGVSARNAADADRPASILSSRFCTLYALEPEVAPRLSHCAPFVFVVGRLGDTQQIKIEAPVPTDVLDRRAARKAFEEEREQRERDARQAAMAPSRELLSGLGYVWTGSGSRQEVWGGANVAEYRTDDIRDGRLDFVYVADDGRWEHASYPASRRDGRLGYSTTGVEIRGSGTEFPTLEAHLEGLRPSGPAPR